MHSPSQAGRFETLMLPHLDAAYALARALTRNPHDAEDVVQEAYWRALRYFDGFRGSEAKRWLLAIVRHTCYSARRLSLDVEPSANMHDIATVSRPDDDRLTIEHALAILSPEFREVIVLREIQGYSYKEIAHLLGVPPGTVMSRLARGRERMRQLIDGPGSEEAE